MGGFLVSQWGGSHKIEISEQTRLALTGLGIHDFSGLAPREVFMWSALLTPKGFVSVVLGGFLVGFGTAYAGGCTSGHAISGLADLQLPSLIAVVLRTSTRTEAKNFRARPPVVVSGFPNMTPIFSRT